MGQLGNVFKEYSPFWRPREAVAPPGPTQDEILEAQQQRASLVMDARVAVGTMFFKEYRDRLEREVKSLSPNPALGSDVAACVTFQRSGLEQARAILEHMIRLAEEKIGNE